MISIPIGLYLIRIGMMLIVWLGFILFAVWMVWLLFKDTSKKSQSAKQLSAREILDQRYAMGEITREQYEMMKIDLAD